MTGENDDPNAQAQNQKQEWIRQELKRIQQEEAEREKQRKEQEQKEQERIRKAVKEVLQEEKGDNQQQNNQQSNQQQNNQQNNANRDSESVRQPGKSASNPYEKVEVRKRKKTLVNPMQDDGVKVAIDPASSNYEFEFDDKFDDETKNKFYQQLKQAKDNDKAITVPDGVKAYKVTEEKEENNEK